ncbi:MAG: protein kinase [Verrucomicrobiota bacterium]
MVLPDFPEDAPIPSDEQPADQDDFVPPAPEELNALFTDYHIEHLIAQGGMGAVYRGIQTKLDRPIAIKILPRYFGADKGYAERFELEAKAMARLTHNNIVGVFDYGESSDGRFLYFIMEFVEGSNLHERILEGPLSENEAITILRQACSALQYAHENGVIHRDIKPANLLLDQSGQVKIADFGLAKMPAGDVDDTVFGTPEYIAPEALVEGVEIDHRSDIFSLGVLTYELLIGEPPRGEFQLPSVRRTDLDPRLDDIILHTIAPDPDARYDRVSEIEAALSAIQSTPKLVRTAATGATGGTKTVRPSSRPVTRTRPAQTKVAAKKKSAAPAIFILLGIALVAAGTVYYFANRNTNNTTSTQDLAPTSTTVPVTNNNAAPDPILPPNTTKTAVPEPNIPDPIPPEPDPVIDPSPKFEAPPVVDTAWDTIRSKGGRLRGYGVADSGLPLSIERAAAYDDIVKIDSRSGAAWIALRSNGDIVSPKPNEQDLTGIRSFHAGGPWALFVKDDGTVWNNQFDQRAPDDLQAAVEAAAGNRHGAALNSDGSVFVFGTRHEGGNIVSLPPITLTDIVDIAVSGECVAAVDSSGNVHLWDKNFELVTLEGKDIVEIESGLHHFVARTRLGEVLEWSGADPAKARPTPDPADLGQAIAVRAGGGTSAAQRTDGTWLAWGREGYRIPDAINNLGPAIDIAFHCSNNSRGFVLWIEPSEGARAFEPTRVGDRLVSITGAFRDRYQKEYLAVRNEAVDKLNQQLISAFERSHSLVSPTSEVAGQIQNELDRINRSIERNSQPYDAAPNLFPRPSSPGWMPDRMREYRDTYRSEFQKSIDAVEGIDESLLQEYLAALDTLEQETIAGGDDEEIARIEAFMARIQEEGPNILAKPQ